MPISIQFAKPAGIGGVRPLSPSVHDGHHRISVARSLDQTYSDSEILRMRLERHIL